MTYVSVRSSVRNRLTAMGLALFVTGAAESDVLFPAAAENLIDGATYTLAWDPVPGCPTVDISVYQGTDFVCDAATGVSNASGLYDWTVDDCGLQPACNLRLRIGCGTAEVWSERFSIDGRLLTEIVPRDRQVDLSWSRLDADTLGAGNAQLMNVPIFGGYNVWARTLDNQVSPLLRDRFTKLRLYDVTSQVSDTIASFWSFGRDWLNIGPVRGVDDDGDPIVTPWVLAQTFTPDEDRSICSARMFRGLTIAQWDADLLIVSTAGGLPNLADTLGFAERNAIGGADATGFVWVRFDFPVPVSVQAGVEYALVANGKPSLTNPPRINFSWVHATYDAYAGGIALSSEDAGQSWTMLDDADFGFVLAGAPTAGPCTDWIRQRRGGDFTRHFTDPDSINALTILEEGGSPVPIPVDGPFNGFHVEYAVTAFERTRLASSGTVELRSACEDTIRDPNQIIPDGVQPNRAAVWPETIVPESPVDASPPFLSDVYPVPNPYVRDVNSPSYPRWELPGQHKIQFMNLPNEATIRIYTMAGDLVRRIDHADTDGSADWDLRNTAGELVTSGIYLWIVKTDGGEDRSGQLVIVR